MSFKLTKTDVRKVFCILKQKAYDEYNNHKLNASWSVIQNAVSLIQEFNWEYADDDLEELLQDISLQIFPEQIKSYEIDENKVVVVDDWCTSYVLVLQYIDALVAAGKEILYITSANIEKNRHKTIISRLSSYPKLTLEVVTFNRRIVDWSKQVYSKIIAFHPAKIIAHIGSSSPFLPILAGLPKQINRYRSNLDDQCFWLGRSAIDYCLEFRPFGVAVSRDRRKLKSEQQLYVPFYPVVDGNPFEGFPELPQDSVIIFSGGDFYKTLDPSYTYWNLVKRVLQENPKAVFLFATKNGLRTQQEFLERFVKENHLEKQFIFIGFRPDINEVFAHADIFFGTCPVCGSLTSQLAAMNKKPILQYYLPYTYDDETEQALNYNDALQISFTDVDLFLAEAKRLINDSEYRKLKGEQVYNATIKPEQFNQVFIDAITTNKATCPSKKVDYIEVECRWWWPEQMGFDEHITYIVPMLQQYGLLAKVPLLKLKYDYRRFVSLKLLNLDWYKYKLGIK